MMQLKWTTFAKRLTIVVIAVMALFSSPSRAEDMTITFAMPTPPAVYLLPYIVANDLGWYAKDGLKVTEKVITGDVNCVRAVVSGDADVTDIGPGTAMQAYVTGGPVKIVGAWQPVVDYRLVALKSAGSTLADLKDKRWAVTGPGSMTESIPKMVLEKHGINGSNMQFLPVGGMSSRLQAVLADKVDATIVDTYYTLVGEHTGKVAMVSSVADDFPGLGFVYLTANKDLLDKPEKRKALEIFVRDGIEGVRYIESNPEKAADILVKRMQTNDADLVTEVLKQMTKLGVWGTNGGLERNVFDFSEQMYRKSGDLTRDVSYEEVVDPSIVNQALEKIGKK